jgi:hypothetical protein
MSYRTAIRCSALLCDLTEARSGSEMQLSDQLLFAGIGRLTREEKLNFTTEGRSVSVCLREHKPA